MDPQQRRIIAAAEEIAEIRRDRAHAARYLHGVYTGQLDPLPRLFAWALCTLEESNAADDRDEIERPGGDHVRQVRAGRTYQEPQPVSQQPDRESTYPRRTRRDPVEPRTRPPGARAMKPGRANNRTIRRPRRFSWRQLRRLLPRIVWRSPMA